MDAKYSARLRVNQCKICHGHDPWLIWILDHCGYEGGVKWVVGHQEDQQQIAKDWTVTEQVSHRLHMVLHKSQQNQMLTYA